MSLRDKDLNLLTVFVAISEELNLTRVSGRLGLSQPALSHALARLREQFGDPLFVRSRRGLAATPRVGTLLPKVRSLLDEAASLYAAEAALDLARLERRVIIAATSYFEAVALVPFIEEARKEAPGLRIETRALSGGFPHRELESCELDLAVAAYFEQLPLGFHDQTVMRDRFVCVCSRQHPYLRTRRTMVDYLAAKHLQIEVPPGVVAHVDQYLQGKKKRREIAVRIGNFLTPPAVLARSDYLLTCPWSLADNYQRTYPLTISELPFRLPAIETKMVWHDKDERDPFHQWLRQSIVEAVKSR